MQSHLFFMEYALLQAKEAALREEVPVGAIVVSPEGNIIAASGNRTRETFDPIAHAEIIVIKEAALALGQWRLDECTLYVTLEPCVMCAAALSLARLKCLVYGAPDPKGGGVAHGPRCYEQTTCHHRPEVVGGILEKECGELLRTFFQERRHLPRRHL